MRLSVRGLLPGSVRLLRNVRQMLAAHPEVRTLRIEGHADDSGDPCFNLSLSMRRVRKVMHWLVANCIAAERLEPLACGRRYSEQGSRSVNVQTTAACRRSAILRRCRAARPLRPIEPK